MLTEYIALVRGAKFMPEKQFLDALYRLPDYVEDLLKKSEELRELARVYQNRKDIFFIGKNLDYALSLEASLKLKEISYIHSEAYAAGELKHGTLSLVQNGTLVIAICTCKELLSQMQSSIKEVSARGAEVISVTCEGADEIAQCSHHTIWLPESEDFLKPSLAIIPMQMFAYYVALLRGCEIDQPRNLAKSVTVK